MVFPARGAQGARAGGAAAPSWASPGEQGDGRRAGADPGMRKSAQPREQEEEQLHLAGPAQGAGEREAGRAGADPSVRKSAQHGSWGKSSRALARLAGASTGEQGERWQSGQEQTPGVRKSAQPGRREVSHSRRAGRDARAR